MNSNFFESIDKESIQTVSSSIWTKFDPAMDLGRPLFAGFLLKTSKSSTAELDTRYFILQENYLIYKQNEDASHISSALKIKYAQVKFPTPEEMEASHSKSAGGKFAIKICSRGKYSVLFARNEEEYQQWMAQLSRVMLRVDFHAKYQVTKAIGQGAFANVYEAVSRVDPQQKFAVKGFNKAVLEAQPREKQSLWNEITILRQLDHPNLLRLHEVHETQNSLYLVTEVVSGGELTQFLDENKTLTPEDLRNIAIGLARGINYLASKQIVHRDLKPNNVLLRKTSNITDQDVVIVDFGLATYTHSKNLIFKRCGTPGYIAPEIISSANPEHDFKVTTKSDMFGLGALIYALICKRNPFEVKGATVDQIIRSNLDCRVNFSESSFESFPVDWKTVLQTLLVSEPNDRANAQQLLANELFFGNQKFKDSLSTMPDESCDPHAYGDDMKAAMPQSPQKPNWGAENCKQMQSPSKRSPVFVDSPFSGMTTKPNRLGSAMDSSRYSFRKAPGLKDTPESGSLLSPNPSMPGCSDGPMKRLPLLAATTAPSKFSRVPPNGQVKLPYLSNHSKLQEFTNDQPAGISK